MTQIIGAGGGGGGKGGQKEQRTPITEKDGLDSRQYANLIDLIGEGPIEGLSDGHKSVFLNDTALQNADGTYNFQDVTIHTREGTNPQSLIPLESASSVLAETFVNVPVSQTLPITRTINDTAVDAAKVTISIPVLQRINSQNGDTLGNRVQLKIEIMYKLAVAPYTESSWIEKINDTIKGRTADEYRKSYSVRFDRTTYTNHTVSIRVTRITANSTNSLDQSEFLWQSYTEVKYDSRTYDDTALVGLRIDAEQFSSIPSRKYLVKGLKVPIPTGVTVDSATGRIIYPTNFIWDGTFQAAQWTSCPAWLLYNLLTNTRYGLGDHLDSSQLDKWSFFRASKYSNELVSDQQGGQEARFACNGMINSTREAFNTVNDLLSIMRCQGFWKGGTLEIAQDSPQDPVYFFSASNVTEVGFSYSNQSLKTRPTVVLVSYMDLVQKAVSYETVKDTARMAKVGVIKRSVTAFACTSRAQAQRVGRWILYEESNTEIVTFTASLSTAQLIKPGQIISISDPLKLGRVAGRIKSATINTVTVDDTSSTTDLTYVGGSILNVILADGSFESRTVNNISDGVITVNSDYSAIPLANGLWSLEGPADANPDNPAQNSLWRVLSIQESSDILYTIQAISHNESKYAHVETGATLTTRDTTNLNVIPKTPESLEVLTVTRFDGSTTKELQYELNGKIAIKVTFHWASASGIDRYRVRWRHEDDNFKTEEVKGTMIDLYDVQQGTYTIQVEAINASGLLYSQPAVLNHYVGGLQENPEDISGLSLVPITETLAVLSWKKVSELDVQIGGRIVIRHDPRTTGSAQWTTSNKIVDGVSGSSTQKQVPLLAGTYFVKAQDYLGNSSTNAASFTTSLPSSTKRLNVKTWSEETAFGGTKVNSALTVSGNNLVLTPAPYVSSGYHDPFYIDGDEEGEYTFATTFDFGHAGVQYDAVLRKEVISASVNVSGINFDSRTGVWDDAAGSFDGTVLDEANVDLYVRTTADDPGSSPTWGNWAEFEAAIIRARGVQVKAVITTYDTNAQVSISDLGATLDLLQRNDSASVASNTSASTGVYNVTFEKPFYQSPQVQITPNTSSNNLFANISSLTRTGFTVTFSDGSSTQDTAFMYTVSGFGRAI